jgi:hypothetical protein
MRVGHAELSERPNLFKRREPRLSPPDELVNQRARMAFGSDSIHANSATRQEIALRAGDRVIVPARHWFKMGEVFISKRDSNQKQVELFLTFTR